MSIEFSRASESNRDPIELVQTRTLDSYPILIQKYLQGNRTTGFLGVTLVTPETEWEWIENSSYSPHEAVIFIGKNNKREEQTVTMEMEIDHYDVSASLSRDDLGYYHLNFRDTDVRLEDNETYLLSSHPDRDYGQVKITSKLAEGGSEANGTRVVVVAHGGNSIHFDGSLSQRRERLNQQEQSAETISSESIPKQIQEIKRRNAIEATNQELANQKMERNYRRSRALKDASRQDAVECTRRIPHELTPTEKLQLLLEQKGVPAILGEILRVKDWNGGTIKESAYEFSIKRGKFQHNDIITPDTAPGYEIVYPTFEEPLTIELKGHTGTYFSGGPNGEGQRLGGHYSTSSYTEIFPVTPHLAIIGETETNTVHVSYYAQGLGFSLESGSFSSNQVEERKNKQTTIDNYTPTNIANKISLDLSPEEFQKQLRTVVASIMASAPSPKELEEVARERIKRLGLRRFFIKHN